MRIVDILAMAIHNLRQRFVRTLLNLIGIIVGCIVVLMTLAAVRGVKETLYVLFDSAETARQIGVISGDVPTGPPPPEAIQVEGQMSEDRKERIATELEWLWKSQNRKAEPWRLDKAAVERIASMANVESVVPDVQIACQIRIEGQDEVISNAISGADPRSRLLMDRLLAGQPLSASPQQEVLLDEFLAYRLGYRSDVDLEGMVGKTVTVEYRMRPPPSMQIFNMLTKNWGDLSIQELAQQRKFFLAIKKLIGDLDSTSLSEEDKTLLRSLMDLDKPEQVALTEARQFVVRGIVRKGDADGIAKLFRGHWQGGDGGILVHTEIANQFWEKHSNGEPFYDAVVTATSTQHLRELSDELESVGARTLSAVRIIERMNESVDESAWVVLGIAAAILLTAGIGVSNTLLISVLERTPEFGILKSVGAKSSTLLWLMVCEGAILGLIGAVVAVVISLLLAGFGAGILNEYLEYRLGGEVASTMFRFTPFSIVLVHVISIGTCVAASIIPAWRAARLDPVIAMRRT